MSMTFPTKDEVVSEATQMIVYLQCKLDWIRFPMDSKHYVERIEKLVKILDYAAYSPDYTSIGLTRAMKLIKLVSNPGYPALNELEYCIDEIRAGRASKWYHSTNSDKLLNCDFQIND